MTKKESFHSLIGSGLLLLSLAFGLSSGGLAQAQAAKSSVDPAFQSAVNLYQKRDYQGAFNLFKNLSKASPKVGIYHYYLALCNQCLSRVDEAKIEYLWVVENDPRLKGNAQAGLDQLSQVRNTAGTGRATASPSPVSTSSPTASTGSGKASASKPTKAEGAKIVYDFYTDWSNPCKAMEPVWEEVKGQYKGLEFKRINAEDPNNAALVQKFSVNTNTYPTIVVTDAGGKALFNQVGAMDTARFSAILDELTGKKPF